MSVTLRVGEGLQAETVRVHVATLTPGMPFGTESIIAATDRELAAVRPAPVAQSVARHLLLLLSLTIDVSAARRLRNGTDEVQPPAVLDRPRQRGPRA